MQTRWLRAVPTASLAVFWVATAVLSLAAHVAVEQTLWPASPLGWASILAVGFGPVGPAFYVWDIGGKNSDMQPRGVLSFAAPLWSTLILAAAGIAAPRWPLLLAAVFIAGGALLAARASAPTEISPQA